MNQLHLRLFISARDRRWRRGLGDWGRGKSISKNRRPRRVMVRKPPYSFKRLVNDYKVRLNVYKIKR